VNRQWRSLLEREARVEAGDAICVGGRDREAPAGVLERTAADPTDVILHGVEHGQKEMAARACGAAAIGKVIVALDSRAALP
jgi:hypothetical protein